MADYTPEQAAELLGGVLRFFKFGPQNVGNVSPGLSAPTETTRAVGTPQLSSPVGDSYPITGRFGENREGHIHAGVDIGTPVGTNLISAINGTVTSAGNNDPGGYGNMVEITSPDGISVRYGHMSRIGVRVGDQLSEGMIIGQSGGEAGGEGAGNSEGPHVHFEVRKAGTAIDPSSFIKGAVGEGQTTGEPTSVEGEQSVSALGDAANPVPTLNAAAEGLMGGPRADLSINQPGSEKTTTDTGLIGGADDNDPAAVDNFLNAIKTKESGGDYKIYNQSGLSNASGAYQFIGSTWKGLGGSTNAAAEASKEEQDRIARAYALQLFNQFHSWRLAAVAWYGGPGIAEKVAQGQDPGSPEGQGGYLDYAASIRKSMAGG